VGSHYTPSRHYNLPRWQPDDMVLGQYWLDIPSDVEPGPATLHAHLINIYGFPYDEVFPIDSLEILPTERNFSLPARVDVPLKADFSGKISLIGLDCANGCRGQPGDAMPLTLHWQTNASPATNYTVFTHLLDDDETVLVNADHTPPKPSQAWVPAEIITDHLTLTLPGDLAPGKYALEIGLYDAADPAFARLLLSTGESRLLLPQSVTVSED
jgi:hypothetical protein